MTSFLNNFKLSRGTSHFFVLSSGILLFYLSFPNVFFLKGCPLFASFFAIFLFRALHQKSILQRFRIGVFWGLGSYLLLVHWVFPIDVLGYFMFALALSVQVIVFSLFYREDFAVPGIKFFYVPCLWVVSEYCRAMILGGFAWTLGHSQAFVPTFIQIMDLAGPYAVSFFLILVNFCLYSFFFEKSQRRVSFIVLVVCVLGVLLYGKESLRKESSLETDFQTTVCSVQPNLSPEEKLNPENLMKILDLQTDMSYACLAKGTPSLIVWPEIAFAEDFWGNPWLSEAVKRLSRELDVPLLLGTVLTVNGKDYNGTVLISPDGNHVQNYHKQKLIPFAEYSPLQKASLKKIFYKNPYEFTPGDEPGVFSFQPKTSKRSKDVPFGVLICSEEMYPSLLKRMIKKVCFVNTLLNDGWFQSPAALMMHAQTAIAQAVSFRVPILRTSNTGLSLLIHSSGEIQTGNHSSDVSQGEMNQKDVFLFNVSCKNRKSFYSQYGGAVSCFFLLFVLFINISKSWESSLKKIE